MWNYLKLLIRMMYSKITNRGRFRYYLHSDRYNNYFTDFLGP